MRQTVQKYGLLVAVGLAVICIVIAALSYNSSGSVNTFIYSAYIFLGIAILAAVLLPLYQSKDNPRSLLKVGAGLLAIALLFGVSWLIATDYTASTLSKDVSSGYIKLSGAIITTVWFFLGLGLVGIIVTEVKSLIKK